MSAATRTVIGKLGFNEPMTVRPKFHANNNTLDVLNVTQQTVSIEDARRRSVSPSLDVEGFELLLHTTRVKDFRNREEVDRVYTGEIHRLLLEVSGADHVDVTNVGILRFSERSQDSGALNNSRPARFVHIDVSDATAQSFYARSRPDNGRKVRRSAQYNVWRVLTPPPQDVPLAVCDARSLAPRDLIAADAIFDQNGQILFSFEALLLRYNADQRWFFYSDMRPDEALVFKTHDTDPNYAHHVPHGAFDDPLCPADAPPRASVEARGAAYWFE